MTKTIDIYVTPGLGRWNVKEEGFEASIAFFPEKEEALKYAIGLAKTKSFARVKVIDEFGRIQSEQSFTMDSREK